MVTYLSIRHLAANWNFDGYWNILSRKCKFCLDLNIWRLAVWLVFVCFDFTHAKPRILSGDKSIFMVVIYQWRSPLCQSAHARTINEYDFTMPVPHVHVMLGHMAIIFTCDLVTHENHCWIASLVTKKLLFTLIHTSFYISCYSFCRIEFLSNLTPRNNAVQLHLWLSLLSIGASRAHLINSCGFMCKIW